MIVPFADQLRKQMRERMNNLSDDISTGQCADWSAYQRAVGEIEGLARYEAALLELVEAYEKGTNGGNS